MDRNTIQKILAGIFLLACVFIGLKTFNVGGLDEKINLNQSKCKR
jgi:hypothetical protein